MMKRFLPFLLLLLFSFFAHSQEFDNKKHINKVHKEYVNKLKLDATQSKKFKTILKKYNPILKDLFDKKSSKNEVNSQIKLMDLEVYKLLSKEQFSKYKKVKLELESFKKYKF